MSQFSNSYTLRDQKVVDAELAYDDANFQMQFAKMEEQLAEIDKKWRSMVESDPFEKKSGKDLIGIESPDAHPMVVELKKMIHGVKNRGVSIESKTGVYKIPSVHNQV